MRPWAGIITVLVWVTLSVVLLPYEFRAIAWPWLTVKILGSVIGSALLPIPATVPLYLVLKAH